jgi:hypothetical protein
MESDLCGLQPQDFRDCRLIDGLELRASPHFSAVAVKTDGRIQWLHGTMGQVREVILRHHAIAAGHPRQRLRIAAGHRDVARRTRECCILRPELCTVGAFYCGEIPIDLQAVARLLCGPELVSDDGHPGAVRERDFEHLPHAFDAAGRLVIDALDARAKNGRMRDDGCHHARQVEVQAKLE